VYSENQTEPTTTTTTTTITLKGLNANINRPKF